LPLSEGPRKNKKKAERDRKRRWRWTVDQHKSHQIYLGANANMEHLAVGFLRVKPCKYVKLMRRLFRSVGFISTPGNPSRSPTKFSSRPPNIRRTSRISP